MERRWRAACKAEKEQRAKDSDDNGVDFAVSSSIPTDSELSESFSNRKKRYVFSLR